MLKSKSKLKSRSEASMKSSKSLNDYLLLGSGDISSPLDVLLVRILCLRMNEDQKDIMYNFYKLSVSFFDQLLIRSDVRAISRTEELKSKPVAMGTMLFDPSDHEKMCLFANTPLIVNAKPIYKDTSGTSTLGSESLAAARSQKSNISNLSRKSVVSAQSMPSSKMLYDILCCNIDILPIFMEIDNKELRFDIRMEPMVEPNILLRKSWDNLPLLSLEVSVRRNMQNRPYHKILNDANYITMTVIGAYNLLMPYDESFQYTAATHMPLNNELGYELYTFGQGEVHGRRFNPTALFPGWESNRSGGENFTKGNKKLSFDMDEITNNEDIDLKTHLNNANTTHSIIWASFHRTLLIDGADKSFIKRIRAHKWPLEVHISSEYGGFSMMAPIDLFRLLYPGEKKIRLAIPLEWLSYEGAMETCGHPPLLIPVEFPSANKTARKNSNKAEPTVSSADLYRYTGADDSSAFILVDVTLFKPLKKIVIPPVITLTEINEMLREFEKGPEERECTGRGFHKDWSSTVQAAANSIRKVPYYGSTEICIFNRQLSETRTRVELVSAFWQEAAKYVNDNFVLDRYINSDDTFDELLLIAHSCMVKEAENTLITDFPVVEFPILRAARHSRQLQDMKHARHLYMQATFEYPNNCDIWRELATCIKDLDRNCAYICMYRAMELDYRHPLSLLSMGTLEFENDPAAAEPFFLAILSLYPFYTTLWYAAYCYYLSRDMFEVADKILELIRETRKEQLQKDLPYARSWEFELGDWWDPTPLLPGMSWFYDAADLLLRIRALSLADIAVAQALLDSGETAAYFHMLALCCRLRGDITEALCHAKLGREKFGEISYLITLEAECLYKNLEITPAMNMFEKAGTCIGPYTTLLSAPSREHPSSRTVLVDLLRRQPSAYSWMALASDWMQRAASGEKDVDTPVATTTCAAACADQALRIDRTFARAWALLSKLAPAGDRRLYCRRLAAINGYRWQQDEKNPSDITSCYVPSKQLVECRCHLNSCECPLHRFC